MNYREVAMLNEQRLREKCEKYETYIYNMLTIIQERELFDDKELRQYAIREIGISTREFNKIMGKE